MRTIPPAVTFIINKLDETQPNENRPPTPKQVEEWMIEFAKMHCEKQAKIIYENIKMKLRDDVRELDMNDDLIEVDKNSILTAYSLDNVR